MGAAGHVPRKSSHTTTATLRKHLTYKILTKNIFFF